MKQIVSYELRKLFRNRLILFMLLLFSILNICHIFSDYQKSFTIYLAMRVALNGFIESDVLSNRYVDRNMSALGILPFCNKM